MEWQILSSLDEASRRRVLGHSRRRRFRRREVIFHEGDPGDSLHLLASGHVAVRVSTPLGDVATLRVLGPGDFFGELAIISEAPRNASVVALEAAETLSLYRSDIEELRRDHRDVDRLLLAAAAAEIRRLSSQLLDALYVPVPKRLARRLVELASLYEEASAPIVLPLTQEDLAELAGTSRPTVNKVLQNLEEAGALTVSRGRVTVLDSAVLERWGR